MLQRTAALLVLVVSVAAAGCAGSDPRQCNVGADCASGFCRADGTCEPVDGPDGGTADGDAGSSGGTDGQVALCTPNHDGTLERSEVPLAAGRSARFRVAVDTPIDTTGSGSGDARSWDFSGTMAGDADVTVALDSLDGTWFASKFPGASYVTRLSQREELLGVFEITDSALLLRGVVSPEDGLYRTELVYSPPVRVLAFPLAKSAAWTTTSTVSGFATGVAAYYTERYDSIVDARGELDTPYGTFPVLRVQVELTRTVGAAIVTSRTFMFVAECSGIVATAVSEDYETTAEFTTAAEVRRLTP